jgi:Protein of unknown function (DUF3631)/Domain of unknown function (DUF3854)
MTTSFNRPGISDAFLEAAGVTFSDDLGGHLRIPYHDRGGQRTGHYRVRLKEVQANGQKYAQPVGSGIHVYFPHIPLTKCSRLWVTEGEFKALSMWEAGNPSIGLPGLHCYTRDQNGHAQIVPTLYEAVRFAAPGEIVFIGDADTVLNIEYYRSGHFLAESFPKVRVKLLQLPLGSSQKGIDDLRGNLDGEFPAELDRLYQEALAVDPEESFLLPPHLRLAGLAKVIDGLPPERAIKARRRVCQMAAWAKLTPEPQAIRAQFLKAAQEATGFNKAMFESSVEDEINGIKARGNLGEETAKSANTARADVIVEDTEPWPEPVDPAELGRLLLDCWKRHLVTSDVNYWALVLWTILTHLKDRLSIMPQLCICSAVKRCGKTRTLEVLVRTVWKGLLAASVSPAAAIRTFEKYEPCFLIDEFDAFLQANEEFRGVLNTCHSRGVVHIRCHPETHEPQAFNAFCAVAIALIGELSTTVEDRAIIIYLKRKQSSQHVLPVRKMPPEVFVELRRKIRRFVLDYGEDILEALPVLPKLSNDRALENWEPLAQIAQILGGEWSKRAFICAKTLTPSDSDEQSLAIQLLVGLRRLFKECGLDQPGREEEILPTNKITAELNKDTEARGRTAKNISRG